MICDDENPSNYILREWKVSFHVLSVGMYFEINFWPKNCINNFQDNQLEWCKNSKILKILKCQIVNPKFEDNINLVQDYGVQYFLRCIIYLKEWHTNVLIYMGQQCYSTRESVGTSR